MAGDCSAPRGRKGEAPGGASLGCQAGKGVPPAFTFVLMRIYSPPFLHRRDSIQERAESHLGARCPEDAGVPTGRNSLM